MSNKYTLLTFKGICMNFLLQLNFFILSNPVTFKQPHKTYGTPCIMRSVFETVHLLERVIKLINQTLQ